VGRSRAEEAGRNPFFKKAWDSQRAWAAISVPAKRFMQPPYSFAANYYWPEAKRGARQPINEKGVSRRRPGRADQPLLRRGALRRPSVHLRHTPTDRAARSWAGDDVAAQTRQVFRNMKLVLDAAGASFADILKVTVYLLDVNDRARSIRPAGVLRRRASREHPHRREGTRHSGMKVEIEAVVGLGR
jgi:hypothetical protein